MRFGSRVRELRREREISQETLAAAAGISRFYLIQIEKGRATQVSVEVAGRIADALETSLSDLFAEQVPA